MAYHPEYPDTDKTSSYGSQLWLVESLARLDHPLDENNADMSLEGDTEVLNNMIVLARMILKGGFKA